MKTLHLLLFCSLLLPSCSWFKNNILKRGEYTPAYLQQDSPLDPPGTAQARAAARARLVKEGAFAPGSTPEVQKGKAFLFDRNPDHTEDPGGRMVETTKAKIIACEGLYYFVETDGGKRGFMRESDFVDPVRLASTSELINPGLLPDFNEIIPIDDPSAAPIELDNNQKLMTNENGRTVVITQKKSDKSEEFEAQKRAIEAGQSISTEEEPEPLPDPAGTGN